jgi:hypothetical protein
VVHTTLISVFCPDDFVARRIESVHQNKELLVGNGIERHEIMNVINFLPLLFLNEQGIKLRQGRLICISPSLCMNREQESQLNSNRAAVKKMQLVVKYKDRVLATPFLAKPRAGRKPSALHH